MASAKTNFIRLHQIAFAGFLIFCLFGRGLYVEFLYLATLALLVRIRLEPTLLGQMRPLRYVLVLAAILSIGGSLASSARPEFMSSHLLILFVIGVACVYLLPGGHLFGDHDKINHSLILLLFIFVIAQYAACILRKNDFGLYTNIHFLALYTASILPLLVYLWFKSAGIMRALAGISLLVNLLLLLTTQSRPAWLAALVGATIVIPFMSRPVRVYSFVGIVGFSVLVYTTGFFGVDQRIDSLLNNLANEDRVFIWRESWQMQMASRWQQWIFGHGFGSFLKDYKDYSSLRKVGDYRFPHNFVLEILYANGIFGLILVVFGYAYLIRMLLANAKNSGKDGYYYVSVMLLATATIHFVHTFFTVQFYSRYTLAPLAIIVGLALRIHIPLLGEGFKSPLVVKK